MSAITSAIIGASGIGKRSSFTGCSRRSDADPSQLRRQCSRSPVFAVARGKYLATRHGPRARYRIEARRGGAGIIARSTPVMRPEGQNFRFIDKVATRATKRSTPSTAVVRCAAGILMLQFLVLLVPPVT